MIGIVPDSNVLIRGLLSNRNSCRKLIDLCICGELQMYGNDLTYKEFCEVLDYTAIRGFIKDQMFTKSKLCAEYESLVIPIPIKDEYKLLKVCVDPDDDEFFKIALSAGARIIVSADKKHILKIKKYENIHCIDPERFMQIYNSQK